MVVGGVGWCWFVCGWGDWGADGAVVEEAVMGFVVWTAAAAGAVAFFCLGFVHWAAELGTRP